MRAMPTGATRGILLFLMSGLLASCAAREAARAPAESGAATRGERSDEAVVEREAVAPAKTPAPPAPPATEDRTDPQLDFAPGQGMSEDQAEALMKARRGADKAVALKSEATQERVSRRKLVDLSEKKSEARDDRRAKDEAGANKVGRRAAHELSPDDTKAQALKPSAPPRPTQTEATDALLSTPPQTITTGRPTVVPAKPPQDGLLWIHDAEAGPRALQPKALRVVSHIQGARVRTVLDYVFYNPEAQTLAGTFHLELPPDATPAGFTVFDGAIPVPTEAFFDRRQILPGLPAGFVGPEQTQRLAPSSGAGALAWSGRTEARVVAHTEARRAQALQVSLSQPSSTLQWGGGQTFTAQVFPVPAKSLKRVVIAYEAPLVYSGTEVRYRLPQHPQAGLQWQATVFVDDSRGELVAVPPQAHSSRAQGWTRLELTKAPGEAQLQLRLPAAGAVLRSAAGPGLDGDVFWAKVAPQVQAGAARHTGRAIFMVDTSGSETPAKAARRAGLMQALLSNDPTLDAYAVMLFDVRARWLHGRGFRKNHAEGRAQTLEALQQVYFEGATSLEAAIAELEASRDWAVQGGPTTVFLLSDGQATWGEDAPQRLLARYPSLKEVRLMAYRFDAEPSRGALLSALAQAGGGQVVSVMQASELAAASTAHLKGGAALVSVKVKGAPVEDLVVDGDPQQLFVGQVLTVAGRLPKGGRGSLEVTWRGPRGPQVTTVDLGEAERQDPLAARAWADLWARHIQAHDDPRFDRLLLALAQRFSLSNRKASFVVLKPGDADPRYDFSQELRATTGLLAQMDQAATETSRREAEGLGRSGLSHEVQALLDALRQHSDRPGRGDTLLSAPEAGGAARAQAEVAYRAARREEDQDLGVYEQIARVRALAGDTAGALRALSSKVEQSDFDPASTRTVGYALLALGQYEAAAELFARLRRLRPFEAQALLEEALALEALGRLGEAALRYELLLSRSYGAQTEAVHQAAGVAYHSLLDGLTVPGAASRRAALVQGPAAGLGPEPVDLSLSLFGAVASAQLDLWVYEPDGRRISAGQGSSPGSGRMSVRPGSGSQRYQVAQAQPGAYDALVQYVAGPHSQRRAPAGLLLVVDRREANGVRRHFVTRLLPEPGAVLLLRTERF